MRNEGDDFATSHHSSPKEFGPYLVFEQLGMGGMAIVHRANKRGPAGFVRGVALKRMHAHLSDDAEFVRSFAYEAKLASLLVHPNIAQIYDFGVIDNVYYIAMEHVDGFGMNRLQRYCQRAHVLAPLPVVLSLLCELCEALEYAHTRTDENGAPYGIIHRDVSLSNLIVTYTGHLKVIDFGIAKASAQPVHTEAGFVKGKLGYMSPEAIEGRPVGPASDVFSAGVVAHEILTGERLFQAMNDREMLLHVRQREIPPPSHKGRSIPAALDGVVMAALERDDQRRLQSAGAFGKALAAVADEARIRLSAKEVAEWWARGGALRDQHGPRDSRPSSSGKDAMRAFPQLVEPSGSHNQDPSADRLGLSADDLRRDSLAGSDAQQLGSVERRPGERPAVSAPRMASAPARARTRERAIFVLAGLCTVAAGLSGYQFLVRPAPLAPASSALPMGRPAPAVVKFVAEPADSVVEIGGKEVSRQSPVEVPLERGVYSIAVSHAGYKRWTSHITVEDQVSQTINIALELGTAVVRISSQPAGLAAELDGKALGQVTPAEFTVAPGPHRLVVVGAAGAWSQEFVATIDGTQSFHAVLPTEKRAPSGTTTGVARTASPAPERTPQRASGGSTSRSPAAREPAGEVEHRSREASPEPAAVPPLPRPEPSLTPAPAVSSVLTVPAASSPPRAGAAAPPPPLVPASTVIKLSGDVPAIPGRSGAVDVLAKLCIGTDGHVASVKILRAKPGTAGELERVLSGWRYRPYVDDAGRLSPVCFAVSVRLVFERARGD